MKLRMSGFTLVEVSVALLALGLVLLGAVVFWQQSAGVRVAAVQQDVQTQTRQSLVGFLYAHHRLPCPAVDADGAENCTSGGDLRQVGFVPWQTLGLPRPEAGRLRYGVYREASETPEKKPESIDDYIKQSAIAASDRDLASALDRMNPLRVPTPNPRPVNKIAPNEKAPPPPVAVAELLGFTQSGNAASPLNEEGCKALEPPLESPLLSPPCRFVDTKGSGYKVSSVNMVDVCPALNTASGVGLAPAGQLGVRTASTRRAVAFVVAAPGLLDADGDGQGFDGANASASNASPTFESASLSATQPYDDQVLVVSHAELFSELHCATALAAIAHTHFNTAIGAFVLERALYDYRDQLYVEVVLAIADELSAIAGLAAATAGVTDAAQAILAATGDTVLSAGARSAQIGFATAGAVLAGVSAATAATAFGLTTASLVDARQTHDEFAARTTAITDLSISINRNALTADAIGF